MSGFCLLNYHTAMKSSYILIVLSLLLCFSCKDNDESASGYDIVGTWYGEYKYYNPAAGYKTQFLTITFNPDGTGELDYEAPTSFSKALFRYEVSDEVVRCNGAYATSFGDGDYDENFSLNLHISADRLIPEGKFNMFVLSRSGASDSAGNGNNPDYSKSLLNTWISDDGKNILNITSDRVETYVVNTRNEYVYYGLHDYSDYYNREDRTIVFECTTWFIKECNESRLVLNANGYTYIYTAGRSSDIPLKPDLQEYLPSVVRIESLTGKYSLYFGHGNKVTYFENSDVEVNTKYSGRIKPTLIAVGEWEAGFRDGEIICYFASVSWQGDEYDENKNLFPGWECNKPCIKYITIKAITPLQFNVTLPNGGTYLMK